MFLMSVRKQITHPRWAQKRVQEILSPLAFNPWETKGTSPPINYYKTNEAVTVWSQYGFTNGKSCHIMLIKHVLLTWTEQWVLFSWTWAKSSTLFPLVSSWKNWQETVWMGGLWDGYEIDSQSALGEWWSTVFSSGWQPVKSWVTEGERAPCLFIIFEKYLDDRIESTLTKFLVTINCVASLTHQKEMLFYEWVWARWKSGIARTAWNLKKYK